MAPMGGRTQVDTDCCSDVETDCWVERGGHTVASLPAPFSAATLAPSLVVDMCHTPALFP